MPTARDPQLYIVPVSARVARARAQKTAIAGIDPSTVLPQTDAAGAEFVARLAKRSKKSVHLWAIRAAHTHRGTWSRIEPGDWFLFYSRGRLFGAARVLDTVESRSLASALWGPADGSEFRLLVGFDRIEQLDVGAWHYRSVLGARFIGFRRVSDDFRGVLLRKFGSVESFIEDELATASAAEAPPG